MVPAPTELAAAPYPRITLPDGTRAFCLNKSEAKLISREIAGYFRHGIEVYDGATIFDIGANIGLFALTAYERGNRKVKIYSFEPIPPIFEVLRLNTERVDPGGLRIFPFGLSNETKTLAFTYFPSRPGWSSASPDKSNLSLERDRLKKSVIAGIDEGQYPLLRFVPRFIRPRLLEMSLNKALAKIESKSKKYNCTVRRISEILQEHGIDRVDLLKIDVERSELEVLKGIADRDWPKIRQIVMEVELFSTRWGIISALLYKHGFDHIKPTQDAVEKAGDRGMIYAFRTSERREPQSLDSNAELNKNSR